VTSPDDAKYYFGREAELRWLFDRLQKKSSAHLFGERNIGKTWLMKMMTLPKFCQKPPDGFDEGYLFVSLSFQMEDADVLQPASVFRLLREELQERMTASVEVSETLPPFQQLKQTLKAALKNKQWVVFLLDEFESLIRENQNKRFYEHLRALADRGHCSFVTAALKEMKDLVDWQAIGSPFPNVVLPYEVGALTKKAARQLIMSGLPEELVEPMIKVAGCKPFALQEVCSCVWEKINNEGKSEAEALEECLSPIVLEIDTVSRTATWRGKPLKLTGAQFDVLTELAKQRVSPEPERICSRRQLARAVHDEKASRDDEGTPIDNRISEIRGALKGVGVSEEGTRELIKAVRGKGFILHLPPEQISVK
jgi:DNA-binding winged helix-turn-helix (wHTH) protein